MLEVEDWTQPSGNKRRGSGRKSTSEKDSPAPGRLGNKAIPPPEVEVQDTHPSNSHLFPIRTRANSSPTAGPSSLSRLLAQASAENGAENPTESLPDDETPPPELRASSPSPLPFPAVIPPAPSSPPQIIGSLPQHVPGVHSPLRPNSRASRISSTSRFSVGRIPALGSVSTGTPKAAPTIALTEDRMASSSPTSNDGNPFRSPVTPSPADSIFDGLNNIVNGNDSRRRTTSHHTPRTSPLAAGSTSTSRGPAFLPARTSLTATATLANLANSWGASFGRKKKAEMGGNLTTNVEALADDTRTTNDTLARDMLKRLS